VNGRPPLVMDLESVRDDDHVWRFTGSEGCGRNCEVKLCGTALSRAVYRTLRELALTT